MNAQRAMRALSVVLLVAAISGGCAVNGDPFALHVEALGTTATFRYGAGISRTGFGDAPRIVHASLAIEGTGSRGFFPFEALGFTSRRNDVWPPGVSRIGAGCGADRALSITPFSGASSPAVVLVVIEYDSWHGSCFPVYDAFVPGTDRSGDYVQVRRCDFEDAPWEYPGARRVATLRIERLRRILLPVAVKKRDDTAPPAALPVVDTIDANGTQRLLGIDGEANGPVAVGEMLQMYELEADDPIPAHCAFAKNPKAPLKPAP